jgi:hypothetical protein
MAAVMVVATAMAQDSTGHQKLLVQFSEYYSQLSRQGGTNFFEKITQVSNALLQVENPAYRQAKKELKAAFSVKDEEEAVRRLTDTVLAEFRRTMLAREINVSPKLKDPLNVYNAGYCGCVTGSGKKGNDFWEASKACDVSMLNDRALVNRLKVSTLLLTPLEKTTVQQLLLLNSYLNCTALTKEIDQIILDQALESHFSDRYRLVQSKAEEALDLVKRNKRDSLKLLFPAAHNFEQDLYQVQALLKKTDMFVGSNNREGDTTTIVRTYFTDAKKPVLAGQAIFVIAVTNDEARMLSMRYVAAADIKNKEEIIKELREVPPPPMEIIKD